MARRSNGETKSKSAASQAPQVTLLDLKQLSFRLDGQELNVEDASDEQFDVFIRQHIKMGWSLEDRRDAINFALQQGRTLWLDDREKIKEEIQEKSNDDLIFSEPEEAQEASV